jgi:hypothetical protein
LGGNQIKFLHSDLKNSAVLALTYENLTQTEMASIRDHYRGQQGTAVSFLLPDEIWAGQSSVANIVPDGTRWKYVSPPEETQKTAGYVDVTVSLGTATLLPRFKSPLTVKASLATGAVTGAAGDPYWLNVSLLLSMQGANNSTTFTDLSRNGHTISVFGDAKVVTTDSDFPSGALDLDGTGDYLTTPASPDFAFGTGDLTVEGYIKPDTVSDNDGLFSFGSTQLFMALFSGNWYASTLGSGVYNYGAATAGTRQHFAVTRASGTVRLFIDGTQLGSFVETTDLTNNVMNIGYYFSSAYPFDGRISWLRVTKGVARYTSAFTPPTTPFPAS